MGGLVIDLVKPLVDVAGGEEPEGPVCANYPLDDDGALANSFSAQSLQTLAPARNRAQYEFTAPESDIRLLALPAVIDEEPGLVPLVEGETRVCGFRINAVPETGAAPKFYFQLYNIGGSPDSILAHVGVEQDADASTGTIGLEAGPFPGELNDYGTPYTGSLVGAKVALEMTYVDGELSATAHVNGTAIGSMPATETAGGFIALIQVRDGESAPAGEVLDIEIVPCAAALADGYGTFAEGAMDMSGNVI